MNFFAQDEKVKTSLPKTPKKKANIIATLSKSPRTGKILEKRGHVLSPEVQQKLKISDALTKSVSNSISELDKCDLSHKENKSF